MVARSTTIAALATGALLTMAPAANAQCQGYFDGPSSINSWGVTVGDGAQFTTTPSVRIHLTSLGVRLVPAIVSRPVGTDSQTWTIAPTLQPPPVGPYYCGPNYYALYVSNDGGFTGAQVLVPDANGDVSWTLQSSGAERLPKTVYVRLIGNPTSPPTYGWQDDIILDEAPPKVSLLTLTPATIGNEHAIGAPYRLKLIARDANSGIRGVQIATRRTSNLVLRPYAVMQTVRLRPNTRLWVRVADNAGNVTAWRSVKAPKRTPTK